MAILDFSVSGRHGFGSVTQVCFGISVSNFMSMLLVAVGRSLTIVSYVAFKMVALWFWTMFICNTPIAHCYPLLWGGGILGDHWSTISSCICFQAMRDNVTMCLKLHLDCLLNHFFRHRSKKTPKLRVTGLLREIHRWIPHSKGQ